MKKLFVAVLLVAGCGQPAMTNKPCMEGIEGTACTAGGMCVADPGYCVCTDPEKTWLCCGDQSMCQMAQPKEGDICCGSPVDGCDYNCKAGLATRCKCEGHHWKCAPAPCTVQQEDGGMEEEDMSVAEDMSTVTDGGMCADADGC